MLELNVGTLIQILNRLILQHEKLLEIVDLEKIALSSADLAQVQKLTYEKESLIELIRLTESDRINIISQIEHIFVMAPGSLKVSDLIGKLKGSLDVEAVLLETAFDKIINLIALLSERNQYNKKFIEKSLNLINQMRGNVLKESGVRSETYTQTGQKKTGGSGTRLISKEA